MSEPQRTPRPSADPSAYAGAVDHYTSPARRDWVRRRWEEPQLIELLDRAVRAADPSPRGNGTTAAPLRVLDVGRGTGTATVLIIDVLGATRWSGPAAGIGRAGSTR